MGYDTTWIDLIIFMWSKVHELIRLEIFVNPCKKNIRSNFLILRIIWKAYGTLSTLIRLFRLILSTFLLYLNLIIVTLLIDDALKGEKMVVVLLCEDGLLCFVFA